MEAERSDDPNPGNLKEVVINLGKSGLASGDDIKIKEGQKQVAAARE